MRMTRPGLMGEFRTEARSRAFLTFWRGRLRSWQRVAVRAKNSFSAAVVSGTSIWDRSMDSSIVTERRVVVCGRYWPTTNDDGVKGNLDDDNFGDVKDGGLGNDMRALHLVIQRVVVDRKAKRNNVP